MGGIRELLVGVLWVVRVDAEFISTSSAQAQGCAAEFKKIGEAVPASKLRILVESHPLDLVQGPGSKKGIEQGLFVLVAGQSHKGGALILYLQ